MKAIKNKNASNANDSNNKSVTLSTEQHGMHQSVLLNIFEDELQGLGTYGNEISFTLTDVSEKD